MSGAHIRCCGVLEHRKAFSPWTNMRDSDLRRILQLFALYLTKTGGSALLRSKSDAHMAICFRACIEAQRIPMVRGYTAEQMLYKLRDQLSQWSASKYYDKYSVFAKYLELLFVANGVLNRNVNELKRLLRERADA